MVSPNDPPTPEETADVPVSTKDSIERWAKRLERKRIPDSKWAELRKLWNGGSR